MFGQICQLQDNMVISRYAAESGGPNEEPPKMIYFVQRGQAGPIKIGYTSKDDVRDRIANLQTASPEPLNLLGCIDGGREKEQALHRLFSAHRLHGEWFDATPKIFIYLLGLILGRELTPAPTPAEEIDDWNGQLSLPKFLESQEKRIIQAALKRNNMNVTKSARELGITFRALRYAMAKLGLQRH